MYEVLKAAHRHRGTGFVRIIQRCPVYADSLSKAMQSDPSKVLLLHHEKGIPIDPAVKRQFPNQIEHDPSNLSAARDVAQNDTLIPVGLLYQNPDAICYETLSSQGIEFTTKRRLAGLNAALDRFTI